MWKHFFLSSVLLLTCLISHAAPKVVTMTELTAMLPDKVASIDEKPILKAEFLTYFKTQLPAGKIPPRLDNERAPFILAAIAEQMVTAKLIDQYLAARGVKGSPEMVINYYQKQLALLTNDERGILELRLQKQKKTIESWIIEQSKNTKIQKNIAAFEFFEKEFTNQIQIPDAEINKYYSSNTSRFNIPESVEVSHIQLTFNPKSPKEKELNAKKAAEIVAELKKNPALFADIAAKESTCPSKKDGGKIGSITKNMMHKSFENAAFALTPDTISEVVETPNNFHIIRCDARNATRVLKLEEVKELIVDMLKRQEALKRMEQLVAELKAKHKVEIYVKMPEYKAPVMEIPNDAK